MRRLSKMLSMDRRVLIALLPIAAVAFAQQAQQQQPQTGSYSLTGTVVNAATGQPIARALVRLFVNPQQITMSGADGRFEFQNLPAMSTGLDAQKPGFFTREQIEEGRPMGLVRIGKDSDVKVSLYPSGSITGRATSVDGDPLEGVQVLSLGRYVVDGKAGWTQRGASLTDETGGYRIVNLQPGKYLVRTATRPVRVLSTYLRSFGENFDNVYRGVYFPDSPDESGATAITVEPGETAEANFSERTAKAFSISGSITGNRTGRPFVALMDADGYQVTATMQFQGNRFKFRDVLPGDYSVSVSTPQNDNATMYGEAPVNVSNKDVDGVSVEVFRGSNIQVTFVYPPGQNRPLSPPGGIQLTPLSGGLLGPGSWLAGQGTDAQNETFEQVRPGHYRVEYRPNGSWYVTDIRLGQTSLQGNDLTVMAGVDPEPLQVSLAQGAAAINGTVTGAEGLTNVSLLAVPDSDTLTGVRIFVSPSSQFSLAGLAPGSYHVYAFTSINGLEYRNSQAMQKYQDQSVEVNVSSNETKQIDVPLISGSKF